MRYIDVIGKSLKSDFMMDLFETYDVDVIYVYDRTHEGMDDEYNASVPKLGLEFRFDQEQNVATLFMKKKEMEDLIRSRVPILEIHLFCQALKPYLMRNSIILSICISLPQLIRAGERFLNG